MHIDSVVLTQEQAYNRVMTNRFQNYILILSNRAVINLMCDCYIREYYEPRSVSHMIIIMIT